VEGKAGAEVAGMVTLYHTRRLLRTSPEKLNTVRSSVPSPSSDLRLRSGYRL